MKKKAASLPFCQKYEPLSSVNDPPPERGRSPWPVSMKGIRYVIIRYGTQYQLLMPYEDGHLSIGVESEDDPIEIARTIADYLRLPV